MKSHNGMRPQDVVILLKIITIKKDNWQYRELSAQLAISISEISESLVRSSMAGLVDASRRIVHRQALMEFIEYGLHYVFPQVPGTFVNGIPTAHSHEFFKNVFESDLPFVWPDENGSVRGLAVIPLYKGVTIAAKNDDKLYKLLACVDVIRVGRVREVKLALKELNKLILVESLSKYHKNKSRSSGIAGISK